jgi:hypothetical protein
MLNMVIRWLTLVGVSCDKRGKQVVNVRSDGTAVSCSWLFVIIVTAACQTKITPSVRSSSGAAKDFVTVQIGITGRGSVSADDFSSSCDQTCSYTVQRGTPLTFRAVSLEDFFERWDGPCRWTPKCTFRPSRDVTLSARFTTDRYEFDWVRVWTSTECVSVECVFRPS